MIKKEIPKDIEIPLSTPSRNVLFAAKQKCPVEAGRLEGRW